MPHCRNLVDEERLKATVLQRRQPDFRKGYQYPTGDEVVNVSRVIKITSCFGWKRGNAFASLLCPVSVKSIIDDPDVFTSSFSKLVFCVQLALTAGLNW